MKPLAPSVETILEQAVEIAAPEERQAFVEKVCAGDADLRQKVEHLVQQHFRAGDFLEQPAAVMVLEATAGWETLGWADQPGTAIGPYKLLERIGEGGMGLVYVAEQETPVRRRVALKIIKPGMDTRQVVARFEAERQALAMMDHANIARVFDGGATPEGRPYFVMELVRGTPITEYCDAHRLPTRARLALFLDVCAAVQHAHQKGIIHRDLKPANILVSHHDTTPVVKVIDFGVAKAIGGRLTDKTVYTAFAQMVGTPLYMSPEQAGLSDLDVDTRGDVYSLGVLLYELLTSTTPVTRDTLRTAAFDEIRRIIREDEPPRPSARLSTFQEARLSTVAQRRGLDPQQLRKQVRGELDWIVMKALEKDRNRRYESAGVFAADINRFLQDEPVLACPPTLGYRLRKYLRRHRAGAGVATGLALAVLVVVGLLWRELGQRSAAAAAVVAALDRADQLRQQERWPEAAAVLALARGQLEGRWMGALRERVEQAERDVEMLMALDDAHVQDTASDRTAVFNWVNPDALYTEAFHRYGLDVLTLDPEEAARRIRETGIGAALIEGLNSWAACRDERSIPGGDRLRRLIRLADDDPWKQRLRELRAEKNRPALETFAADPVTLTKPPVDQVELARHLEAVGSEVVAESLLRKVQALRPADFWVNLQLATVLARQKRSEEAIRFGQAALAVRPKTVSLHAFLRDQLHALGRLVEAEAASRQAIALKPDGSALHVRLSNVLSDQGRFSEAEEACRRAVSLDPNNAWAHVVLGNVLSRRGEHAEAEAAHRRAIALKPEDAWAHVNLGLVLRDQGHMAEAEASCRTAVAVSPNYTWGLDNLATVLRERGNPAEAEVLYRRSLSLAPNVAEVRRQLVALLREQGKLTEAEEVFRATSLRPDDADGLIAIANIMRDQGKLPEAEAAWRQLTVCRPADAWAVVNLGDILRRQGKLLEAEAAYRTAIALKPDDPWAHENLIALYLDQGRFPKAEAAFSRLAALKPKDPGPRFGLATVFYRMGRKAEAQAAIREGMALEPRKHVAHQRLAFALHSGGRQGRR